MFSLHVFILNASEDLSTPNSFPLPEGSRRYLGAVADDVGVAAAEADSLWLWVCVWYCQILELLCDK